MLFDDFCFFCYVFFDTDFLIFYQTLPFLPSNSTYMSIERVGHDAQLVDL
jgi:hypothetical protein